MSTRPVMVRQPSRETPTILNRFIAALIAGSALFVAGLLLLIFVFQIGFLGRIYPGIHVAGVDLSGVRRTEAANLLNQTITFPQNGIIALTDGDHIWLLTPEELGLSLDTAATAEAAFRTGRSGWPWTRWGAQLRAWRDGIYLAPQLVFDAQAAQNRLEQLANEINQPTIEATLQVQGLEVLATEGQIGRTLDIPGTITWLEQNLSNLSDTSLALPIIEQKPRILDVRSQAELARTILSRSLILTLPNPQSGDPGPWELDQQTLASMLAITQVNGDQGDYYQIGLSQEKLGQFLAPLAPGLVRQPANARFIFNDETRQLEIIQPAVIGRTLLIDESINHINQQLAAGSHRIELVLDLSNPEITDYVTGEELGITELVSAQTTYFYGSSAGRIQNIETAASQFHGILIPPGATFSMVENIGDISLDSGYAEALIIYGDRTIKGVGGGVCQVSTTLFRTVFFGGFPVVERYSHAYRVYYYELNQSGGANERLAGLDATVYAPVIDFKFTNDTPYWLLMETYINVAARSLTWKFYSTSDGRTVEWDTTGLENKKDPPNPIYEEDDSLAKGEIKQVDWAVEGADVTVTRTVYRDGEVLFTDEFTTHYEPWATVCKYGTGTKNYPPKEKFQDIYSCSSTQD